eukprot:scaffold8474_cov134-Isochrysis_galbana.AAC.4
MPRAAGRAIRVRAGPGTGHREPAGQWRRPVDSRARMARRPVVTGWSRNPPGLLLLFSNAVKWRPAARTAFCPARSDATRTPRNRAEKGSTCPLIPEGELPSHARLRVRSHRNDMDPAVGTSRCRRCTTTCCSYSAPRTPFRVGREGCM